MSPFGMLAQDVLPQTTDQWGFAALVVTSIVGGISGIFGYFKAREAKRVDALGESQARRIEAAEKREADAQAEGVRREKEANDRADKREETANRRMDAALQGMAQLTTVATEQTALMRQMGDSMAASREEVRRLNAGIEALRDSIRESRR